MISLRYALLGLILFLFVPSMQAPLFACDQPPGYGFWIKWRFRTFIDGRLFTTVPDANRGLRARFELYDSGYQPGNTATTDRQTYSNTIADSLADFRGLATPAMWTITVLDGLCVNHNPFDHWHFASSNVPQVGSCDLYAVGNETITPDPYHCIDGPLHITSANFDGTYGNPWLEQYFQWPGPERSSALLFSGVVWMNWDNSIDWTPSAYNGDGTYSIVVYNAQSGGGYALADGGDFNVFCQ